MKAARTGLAHLGFACFLGLAFAPPFVVLAEDLDEVQERIFEVSPFVGAFIPDSNIRYPDPSAMLGVRGALNSSPYWGLEGFLALAPAQTQRERRGMLNSYSAHPVFDAQGNATGAFVITELDVREETKDTSSNLVMFGGSAVINFSKKEFRPFLSFGGGFIDDLSNSNESPRAPFSNLFFDVGLGLKFHKKSGFALRVDVHDFIMRRDDLPRENERAPLLAALRDLQGGGSDGAFGTEPFDPFDYRGKRWLNSFAVTVSATFPFGYVWKDGDGDNIEDRFDDCLTTAPGVIVDQIGCGIDTDQDGVFDGLDECEGTPIGATVSLVGCPSDQDEDLVYDGIDECPDTPMGATVNLAGCPSDTDGDGILDGLDLCNDTPIGAAIDADGCVDNPVEADLLLGRTIRVDRVRFESGSEEIEPLSFHYLNRVARLVERWTGHEESPKRIEIGVYTDGIGSAEFNRDLSQKRAEAVRVYILENFYNAGENNLVAVGYGETKPIADDRTEEGREKNRRVEIRMIGPGEAPVPFGFGGGGPDAGADESGDLDLDLDLELEKPDIRLDLDFPEEIEKPSFDFDE